MKIDNHKLNLLLAERCMSITELRCKGLSPQTLTRVRRGEAVTPKTVGKLAHSLGAPVAEIIMEE